MGKEKERYGRKKKSLKKGCYREGGEEKKRRGKREEIYRERKAFTQFLRFGIC